MAHLRSFEGVHQLYYLGVVDVNSIEQSVLQQADEFLNTNSNNSGRLIAPEIPTIRPIVRSLEERIIESVECSQLNGSISRRPNNPTKDLVAVHVSKTGIKLIDSTTQRVRERLALHTIGQAIAYDDDLGSVNVALLVRRMPYSCARPLEQIHVLQSANRPQDGDLLCKQIRQAFASLQADVQPLQRN